MVCPTRTEQRSGRREGVDIKAPVTGSPLLTMVRGETFTCVVAILTEPGRSLFQVLSRRRVLAEVSRGPDPGLPPRCSGRTPTPSYDDWNLSGTDGGLAGVSVRPRSGGDTTLVSLVCLGLFRSQEWEVTLSYPGPRTVGRTRFHLEETHGVPPSLGRQG